MNTKSFREMLAEELKKPSRKHHRDAEHHLQVACVNWFRSIYPHLAHALFAVPNGGWRNEATGAKLKAEGVTAGVADLILLHPSGFGHYALLIEMKTEEGRQSMSQKKWQANVEQSGAGIYKYKVVRSLEEFQALIEWYLNISNYDRLDKNFKGDSKPLDMARGCLR